MHNTLGKPDRVHVQNMEQLNAYDRRQNVTEWSVQASKHTHASMLSLVKAGYPFWNVETLI